MRFGIRLSVFCEKPGCNRKYDHDCTRLDHMNILNGRPDLRINVNNMMAHSFFKPLPKQRRYEHPKYYCPQCFKEYEEEKARKANLSKRTRSLLIP